MQQSNHKTYSDPNYLKFSSVFLLLWAAFYLLSLILSPTFLTYDSYHYLQLAIHPLFGDSHSVVFGFILKTLAELSLLVGPNSLTPVLLLWNTFCLTVLFRAPLLFVFRLKKFIFENNEHFKRNMFFYILLISITAITVIGNLFLVNAFWSELTSLILVVILATLTPYYLRKGTVSLLIASALISALAFHTRYLLVITPVIALCIGLLPTIRNSKTKFFVEKTLLKRSVVLAASIFLAIFISNQILQKTLPSSPIKNSVTAFAISASMQCSLRCDVSMFQKNCSTLDGEHTIKKSTCSEIIFGLVDVGPMVADVSSLGNVFKQAGLWNSIKWVFIAPFTYFNDIHGLELGSFTFGGDKIAAKDYPDVITYFQKYFPKGENIDPSPAFAALIKVLHVLFYDRFFHKLAIFLLLACLVVLKKSQSVKAQFFAFYAVGTFFLFAYLNPEVPFRFQMQMITPALISLILFCEEKWINKTKLSA